MCGISGLFSEKSLSQQLIAKMTDVIEHRGPDDSGQQSLLDGRIWLGHRRLSILDLSSAGHQPMSFGDGRYYITYNGEVYNYLELRKELESMGYTFQSRTDTEVILASFDRWGTDCLHRFNGMWAFLIVDTVSRAVFASRDRFGVKPLYYWRSPEGFWAFASEIKQFTVLPGWEAVLNLQRAYDFLNWSITDHTAETLFAGVWQLQSGQAMQFSLDNLPEQLLPYQWYQIPEGSFSGTMQDAAIAFRDLLEDAVRLRLRSDVPVGSCLSGGLDSSSIVCMASQLIHQEKLEVVQHTVSSCSDIKKYDEREFIDEVVKSRQLCAHFTTPDFKELLDKLDELTWLQDEPFTTTSIFAQWCVFDAAKKNGLKVMLDGQGADEALAGYHSFFARRFAGLFNRGQWGELYHELLACRRVHGYSRFSLFQRLMDMLLPERLRQEARTWVGRNAGRPEWMQWQAFGVNPHDPLATRGTNTDTVRSFSISQLTASNLQMLLHYEDRDSMAHSVESRLPFLDYRLVEFVLSLPEEMKLYRGETKRVLREGMKGILPEKIRTRSDKMGFVTPEELWLKQNSQLVLQQIDNTIEKSAGLLTLDVKAKAEAMLCGRETFSFWLWRMVSFGRWLEVFKVKVVA